MTTTRHRAVPVHEAGTPAEAGSFLCLDCSFPLSFQHSEAMPVCPNCGCEHFKRASLFEQPTLSQPALGAAGDGPEGWLERARESIDEPGMHLAYHADGQIRVVTLDPGWSRIGRSASADIRLDDPTVSRRHAVIICTPEGEMRILDDRSMNGVAINGESADWGRLADGDEIRIGRFSLYVIA
jgi:predicted  nucleic acid-binding Zn-ribbon protein